MFTAVLSCIVYNPLLFVHMARGSACTAGPEYAMVEELVRGNVANYVEDKDEQVGTGIRPFFHLHPLHTPSQPLCTTGMGRTRSVSRADRSWAARGHEGWPHVYARDCTY